MLLTSVSTSQALITYARMESLLVKTLNSQDNSTELQFMEKVYSDVVDIEILTTKMEIFKVLLEGW